MNHERLTREQVLSIPVLRNKGKTNEEIAAEFKVARNTVAYWVRRLREDGHEIKRFGRGGRKPLELNK